MHAIQIYRHKGGWAFDDLKHGLVAEELIEGADTLVDRVLGFTSPANGDNRALVCFSDHALRWVLGHSGPWVYLRKSGESNDGTGYVVGDPSPLEGHKVWLGSALRCYFETAPRALHVGVIRLPDVPTAESRLIVSRAAAARLPSSP